MMIDNYDVKFYIHSLPISVKNWLAIFLKLRHFVGIDCRPIENVQQIWLIKMDFGWPNAKISQKMANG